MDRMNVIKSRFSVDDGETWYDGYTSGNLWNGWACPLFTVVVGLQIAEHLTALGEDVQYDKEKDAFVHTDDFGCVDSYYRVSADYKGLPIYLYPIGSYGWCWQDITWQSLT